MAGYVYRGDKPLTKEAIETTQRIYSEAESDAEQILTNARKQAHEIRQAALMEAERDANAIREAARTEARLLANPEIALSKNQRQKLGQARLAALVKEIYEPKEKSNAN